MKLVFVFLLSVFQAIVATHWVQRSSSRGKISRTHEKCIELAQDLGVRTIQLAGYDVYYEEKSPQTRQRFIKNLRKACDWAEEAQVVLAIEIMDDPFINSIEKYLAIEKRLTLLPLCISRYW